jgi:hypothetical protein
VDPCAAHAVLGQNTIMLDMCSCLLCGRMHAPQSVCRALNLSHRGRSCYVYVYVHMCVCVSVCVCVLRCPWPHTRALPPKTNYRVLSPKSNCRVCSTTTTPSMDSSSPRGCCRSLFSIPSILWSEISEVCVRRGQRRVCITFASASIMHDLERSKKYLKD